MPGLTWCVRKLKLQAADLEDFATSLVAAALSETLAGGKARPSGEHAVHQLTEARVGRLRGAAI